MWKLSLELILKIDNDFTPPGQESITEAGQVATCDLQRGLVCQRSQNPEGCKVGVFSVVG